MTLIVIRLQSGSSQTEPVGIGFPPREGSNNPHINVCKAVPVRINGCFYQEQTHGKKHFEGYSGSLCRLSETDNTV